MSINITFVPLEQKLSKEGTVQDKVSAENLIKKPTAKFVLGIPGRGKSFIAKREIISIIASAEDTVLIIDPEQEYKKMLNGFSL
jgi:hypothetical protein